MRPAPTFRRLVPVLLVLALTGAIGLLPGTPAGLLSGGSHALPSRSGSTGTVDHSTPVPSDLAPVRAALAPGFIGRCAILGPRFSALYPGPALPPTLAPSMNAGCSFGSDEAGLGLLSDASESGTRVDLGIQLPDAASGSSRGLLAYEVRMWVTGVPCSAGGASLLSIDLIPPFGGEGPSTSANWSVWAPVFDLVPAGGCDPTCQNSTALFTLPGVGRSFCENDAIVRGPESGTTPLASLVPGDAVGLTVVGAPGASGGLMVFLNDSTRPGLDRSWGYPANSTISRVALEPLGNVSDSASATGWASGPSVSVVASLCPSTEPSGSGPSDACNSYDGPRVNASSFPTLTGANSWNATSSDYTNPYPWVAPFSPSGACSGLPGVSTCSEFRSGGGTGNYPAWSLAGGAGTLGWSFGGPSPDYPVPLAGPSEFNGSGALAAPVPSVGVGVVLNATASTGIDVRAQVASPAGFGSVSLSVYFCAVQASVPTLTLVAATEDPGPTNTSSSGNFSATVLFAHSEKGTAFYWLTASTTSGSSVRAGPWRATVSGGANTCIDTAPPTPYFSAANVTSIGGGFRLAFTENDSAVANYTLWVTPDAAPYVPFARSLGSTGPLSVFLPSGSGYNFSMTATDVVGLTSAATPAFTITSGILPLTLNVTTSNVSDLWIGADTAPVDLDASGGVAPYTYHLAFGDGSAYSATSPGPWENVSHDFGALNGVAVVSASVTDADGLTAEAAPLGISILAGPLGVNQSLSAGAYDVRLTWSAPASPASPITEYTVFYTNRSAEAPTVADLWSSNQSAPGGFLWNTTASFLDLPIEESGVPCYAIVVAWNALGVGTLPTGWLQTPSALPLNLTPSAISVTPTGGPAPLTVQVSDTITLGTNGTLVEGLYSFGSSGSAPATLASNLSGVSAIWWLNASWTFPTTGTEIILLHASDFFSDTVIPLTSVYIGPASTPSAEARITSGTPLVGQPVDFEGLAGGGTGVYTFNWTFGDGGTGTGPTPTHVFEAAGNYTTILTVTDSGDGLTTLAPVNLTVFANPSVSIETTASGTSGLSFQFNAVETGGVGFLTYSWVFGDGNTGTGATANHTYATPGVFNVSVTVTDTLRHSATAGIVVVAPAPPSPASTGTPPLTGPELAAYALLGALAVLLFIGMLYYWTKSREPPEGPEPPDRFAIERVRAPSPPDPPDPS